MNEQDRFEELWNDYVEGELNEAGMAELKELLAEDGARMAGAIDSFQTHRLLGLCAQDSEERHEDFVRQTMDALPAEDEAFVQDVIQSIPPTRNRRLVPLIPNWLLSAAAAVALTVGVSLLTDDASPTIATISDLSGPALWTGDEGRVIRDLKAGTPLSGGTLEGTAPNSWVKLTFNDGSVVTLSGDSMLTFSELGQKELHLKRGGLSADVEPQAKPMLIHTRSATLTVLGTRFDVETELATTALNVSEGRVGIQRISDGRSVEVAANHRVVAAADVELTPVRLPEQVHSWQSDMSRGPKTMYGKWAPDQGEDGGRLWAIPYVTENEKTIFTTGASVSRSRTPVVLKPDSKVRVRGRLKKHSHVFVGMTLRHRNGDFAGRFQVVLPKEEFSPNEEFELTLPLPRFGLDPSLNHQRAKLPVKPDGLMVESIWSHSLYNQAWLSVSHFGIEEAATE